MKLVTYDLPSFWASALINGDTSGMKESDIEAMNNWLEQEQPGHCIDCSEESFFSKYHDAGRFVLACDCLEFTFRQD